MKSTERTWLTRAQAAERGNVSTRTVDRLLAMGRLARHRSPGTRHVLIDAAELDRLLSPVPERSTP